MGSLKARSVSGSFRLGNLPGPLNGLNNFFWDYMITYYRENKVQRFLFRVQDG